MTDYLAAYNKNLITNQKPQIVLKILILLQRKAA